MSGEERVVASRDYSFQNLVSERKEKKVTRGEFSVEKGSFGLFGRDVRIFFC